MSYQRSVVKYSASQTSKGACSRAAACMPSADVALPLAVLGLGVVAITAALATRKDRRPDPDPEEQTQPHPVYEIPVVNATPVYPMEQVTQGQRLSLSDLNRNYTNGNHTPIKPGIATDQSQMGTANIVADTNQGVTRELYFEHSPRYPSAQARTR